MLKLFATCNLQKRTEFLLQGSRKGMHCLRTSTVACLSTASTGTHSLCKSSIPSEPSAAKALAWPQFSMQATDIITKLKTHLSFSFAGLSPHEKTHLGCAVWVCGQDYAGLVAEICGMIFTIECHVRTAKMSSPAYLITMLGAYDKTNETLCEMSRPRAFPKTAGAPEHDPASNTRWRPLT